MIKMRKTPRKQRQQQPESIWYDVMVILKSSLIAIILTLVCFLLFAVIIKIGGMKETIIPPVVQVILTISIASAGFIAARASQKMGWMKGAITGLVYVLWAFIISSLFGSDMPMGSLVLSNILLGIIAGAVGGIIGVNL
ncbi:MAG TPA: TIGR04086 family membrane protein [Clostridia bacterium]|nr:TIGR04086 family membrane protein [Clostridia bacterium]